MHLNIIYMHLKMNYFVKAKAKEFSFVKQQGFLNYILLILGLNEIFFITEMLANSYGFKKFKTIFISPAIILLFKINKVTQIHISYNTMFPYHIIKFF